jgi:Ras GTPase-activating-like protein IQGAP2/3
MVQAKRCVLYIIRVQQGQNLMEILVKPVTEEDEVKWDQLLQEDMPGQKGRAAYSEALFYDLVEYTPFNAFVNEECHTRR